MVMYLVIVWGHPFVTSMPLLKLFNRFRCQVHLWGSVTHCVRWGRFGGWTAVGSNYNYQVSTSVSDSTFTKWLWLSVVYLTCCGTTRVHRNSLFSSFQVLSVQRSCSYSFTVDSVDSHVICRHRRLMMMMMMMTVTAGLMLWSFILRIPVHYRYV